MNNQPTPIIGGINNKVINTCGSIVGGINKTSTGITGTTGLQGSSGPGGWITDWKEDMMKKYPRFTIKTEYDDKTFSPTNNIIIDNRTNEEYKFKPQFTSDIMNETEQFIQGLIITIRDEKITTIINGH